MRNERLPKDRHLTILVAAGYTSRLICGRCDEPLLTTEVATLTRVSQRDPFEPWCVECSQTLFRWAMVGADNLGFLDEAK